MQLLIGPALSTSLKPVKYCIKGLVILKYRHAWRCQYLIASTGGITGTLPHQGSDEVKDMIELSADYSDNAK